ncbi:MAG: leucine-rich repeat domain-containing protein [Muribaculaceae bacterium]|nr:leucine-rich repeat domain-containing protein [Muribaculaceae bacterium]
MKKQIFFVTAFTVGILMFILTGCGKNANDSAQRNLNEIKTEGNDNDGNDNLSLSSEEAIKFLYQAYYDKGMIDRDGVYSSAMINEFKNLDINSELEYPINEELSDSNNYYKSIYSENFNWILNRLSKAEYICDDGIIGFDWDIFWGGQDGPYDFNLEVESVEVANPSCAYVTLRNGDKYTVIKDNGVLYIDNINDLKESAVEIISEMNMFPTFEIDNIFYMQVSPTEVAVTHNPENCYRDDIGRRLVSEYSGEIKIPEQINYKDKNYRVIWIAEYTFSDCKNLTSVIIPNSIVEIKEWAFGRCTGLTDINIPNSVITISEGAFFGCEKMVNVTLSNSLKTIGSSAFRECKNLSSIGIPNTVTSIDSRAFSGCVNLKSIIIPNSVTYLGESAFSGCANLENVTISNSLEEIKQWTFWGCTSITNITIPNSVRIICADAFENCSGLRSVDIPNSVSIIGAGAFENCSSLRSVDIPNSIREIGVFAFRGCTALTTVTIPSMVDLKDLKRGERFPENVNIIRR